MHIYFTTYFHRFTQSVTQMRNRESDVQKIIEKMPSDDNHEDAKTTLISYVKQISKDINQLKNKDERQKGHTFTICTDNM